MPTQQQQLKHATEHDTETETLAKDTVKDEDIANSQALSDTLQQCDIVHIVGNIIHVRQLCFTPLTHNRYSFKRLFLLKLRTCVNVRI